MVITACRANSTGDAVNHSLMGCYPIPFLSSIVYRLIPGLAASGVVTVVIVRVAAFADPRTGTCLNAAISTLTSERVASDTLLLCCQPHKMRGAAFSIHGATNHPVT